MDTAAVLAQGILARLPDQPGPVLLAGPLALARLIDPRVTSLIVANMRMKAAKLAHRCKGLTAMRTDPVALPLAPRSLAALIAVDVIGRLRGAPDEAVASWSQTLLAGGRLIVVERLGWSRTLHHLVSAGRYRSMAPEDLTTLLLNAGYRQIGQVLNGASTVITWGQVRVI